MEIIKNGTILFVWAMVGNVSNYCFQFIMGRYLTLEDYGTMNALLSLSMTITLPTSAIMLVVAKYASMYRATGETGNIASLYTYSLKRIGIIGALVAIPLVVSSDYVREYLRIDDMTPIIILTFGIFWAFILTVNLGILQGTQRFYYLGSGIGLGGFLRLLFGGLVILLGFGLNGAISASVLPTIVVFVITTIPLMSYLRIKSIEVKHERILRYSIPVFVATAVFAFLSNVDLIMVKHFFEPRDAGLYASVAVLGKTLLYLPSAFAIAMFPMVSESDILNSDSFKILDRALLCTGALCAGGLVAFTFFPEILITILFGERFVEAASFLKYYGLAMTCMAIISVLISFNLARHKTSFIYPLAMGGIILVVLVNLFHSSIKEVLMTVVGVFTGLTAVNLFQIYRQRQSFYRLRQYELSTSRTD